MITQMLLVAGGGFLPESKAYFDAMTVQLTGAQKNVVDKFIRSIISGGSWPYLGACYIHTLTEEQQSLLNVINPTSAVTNLSKIGSPIWTSNVGWRSNNNNGNRLSSLGNINNAEFKFNQHNAHISSYVRNNGTLGSNDGSVIGLSDNRTALIHLSLTGNFVGRINNNGNTGNNGYGSSLGFKMINKPNSSNMAAYYNKTLVSNVTPSSATAVPASPLNILTNGNTWVGSATTAFSSVGASMPDAIRESFTDAVNTLITDLDAL